MLFNPHLKLYISNAYIQVGEDRVFSYLIVLKSGVPKLKLMQIFVHIYIYFTNKMTS